MIRQEILSLLAAHSGEFVSGEKMSEQFHLTRAAIWKHIQGLREAGYKIQSQTKSGYRLLETPLRLEEWVMRAAMKSSRIGREIKVYEELGSTNDFAKELVREGLGQDGMVILAEKQIAGRGRQQRQWESPLGGLWMSLLIKPNLDLADAAKLTLSTGIAVANVLNQEWGLDVKIKWPNDLIYQGKKLVGILAEVVGEWNSVQTMIIGIGINANFPAAQLGPDACAVSLQDILGEQIDLNQLVLEILKEMERELDFTEQQGFSTLPERWMDKAAGLGEEVEIVRQGEIIKGVMLGIALDGQLQIDTGKEIATFAAGEIKLRKSDKQYF